MSILITGATGMIGSDLTKFFSKKTKVLAVYRKKKSCSPKNKNIKWIKCDLKKKINFKNELTPDCIIHCAIDQKNNDLRTEEYIKKNILITKNLVEFAKENKVKLFVNFSSIDVYGKTNKGILDEKVFSKKQSDYGYLKLCSEKLVRDTKANYINLRTPGVLCLNSLNSDRPWIALIIKKMLKDEQITIYNSSSKFNNLTSSEELAKFIDYIIKKNIKIKDTFNFACKDPLYIYELINYIKKKIKSKSTVKKINSVKKKSFCISVKKIENKTKYNFRSTKLLIEQYLTQQNLI